MPKLAAAQPQGERDQSGAARAEPPVGEADRAGTGVAARVRLMMLISALTTLIAIAAVVGVIGIRVFQAGGNAASATGVVTLPKGARVIGTAVAGDRIVVTLDIAGLTEIRSFDARTLKETGRVRFATEP